MKAKEFFEKYFGDIDAITTENIQTLRERGDQCFRELVDEIYPLYKKRGSTPLAMEGVIRELNDKYNAISGLMEKKWGTSIWNRNGLKKCWDALLDKYTKPKEEPETSKTEDAEDGESVLQPSNEN